MVNNWRRIFFPSRGATALHGPGPPDYRVFTITIRHTTFGRTPLDGWSAWRSDLYLTTHNTHNSQTSMPLAAFEPANPVSERPQTHALDRVVTGFGDFKGKLSVTHPVVLAVKQPTFLQSNTTQVYSVNLNCPHMCATCFGMYFGHLQASQRTNIYGKIQ